MITPEMLDRLITQGEGARSLLASSAWVDVTNDLHDQYLAQMIQCPVGAEYQTERDNCHLMLTALRELAAALTAKVQWVEDYYADRNSTEDDDQ